MPKISKTLVESEQPGAKPRYVWDDEVKGFGLQVLPTGAKSFVYQYRDPHGRTRRGTLGKLSRTFTAEQARVKATKWRRQVEDGGDPLGAKQADREALTVSQMLDLWTDSARFKERATLTQDYDRGRVERHLKPTLGKLILVKLTPEDVRKAFAAIRDGKTACDEKSDKPRGRIRVRGGEGAARMAIRVFRAAMNWAIAEGHAAENPAQHVKLGNDARRHVSISTKQYKALFKAIDKMAREKRLREPVADAVRVLALTGARRGEIAGLRWRHVNMQAGVLRLPPSTHKTGKRTGEDRVIGLPSAAQAIITRQPAGEPDDLVFKPAKGEGVIALSHAWQDIRAEAQLPEGLVLHGLRHGLASMMATQGAEAAEIMAALGHRQLSTAQRYIDIEKDARAALVERHTKGIAAAMAGKKKPAKVTRISRRASA